MFFTATDGYGIWYGSFDGGTWVEFPCQPQPGDEAHIDANLNPDGNAAVVFAQWKRRDVVTRAELEERKFQFGIVDSERGNSGAVRGLPP